MPSETMGGRLALQIVRPFSTSNQSAVFHREQKEPCLANFRPVDSRYRLEAGSLCYINGCAVAVLARLDASSAFHYCQLLSEAILSYPRTSISASGLSPVSCLLSPVSCLLSPASCLLPPILSAVQWSKFRSIQNRNPGVRPGKRDHW